MRLAAKLILIAFLAQAALTCTGAFIGVQRQLDSFQEGREDKARELSQQVTAILAKAWQDGGRTAVQNAMHNMPSEVQYTRMRWVQFNVEPNHPDSPSVARDSLHSVVQGEVDSVVVREDDGDEWLHTYLPVALHNEHPFGIEMTDSLELLEDRKKLTIGSALHTIIGLSVISLGVAVIAGIRLVGRPLEKLIAKTKQIREGDLLQPVVIGGHDELSQLGDALNDMSDYLHTQRDTLESEAAARIATLSQLRHADRLKTVGRLAAGVAHEMGTPLNVISGRAGLIAGGKLSGEEVRQSATTIKAEADRITSIIRQLLDFARRTTLQRNEADLRAVVSRTAKLLEPLAVAKHVQIDVAQTEQPLMANIDEGQFQQVLTNIMINAIQSMSDEGSVTVCLGTRKVPRPDQDDRSLVECSFIEVVDNGCGISPEHRDQVFEPFFTTKDVGDGTGLGLSIAYGIVQEHGGWIDVQSAPGHGSCFTIYLPQETK